MIGVVAKLGKLLFAVLGSQSTQRGEVRISQMPGGDQVIGGVRGRAMDQAIQAARETLPVFWAWHETRALDPGDPNDCALKVKFPNTRGGWEHIWLIDIRRTGPVVSGLVASEPEGVPDLQLWQPKIIETGNITDWGFRKADLMYGHFTTRILAAAHPEVAEREVSYGLSPTPLPSEVTLH
jgi:uncharacterized protein YegJ (DUF2314 family)